MKHIRFKTNRFNTHSRKYDSIKSQQYPSDTLPMWVADMDIEVDERILQGLHDYLDEKILGYALETQEYTQSIQHYLKRRHDLEVECSWVVTTPNVVSSINACILALTQPKESVLVLEPVYMPFFKSVEAVGRQVVFSSLVDTPAGYMMDLADIEAKVKAHDVKMVLFCSPHNPVGRVWREDEVRPFLELMNRYHVIVVSDEIHMDFMFKGHHHLPLMKFDPHVIMLMSASKTFNLASTHVSQMIVQDRVIRKKIKSLYSQLGLFHHHEFGIRATTIAYSHCDDYIDELCEVIESNVTLVKEALKDSPVQVTPIEGTYLVWLNVKCVGLPTAIIQKRLIQEASLWLHDGSIFGPTGEGYLRMNVATSPQVCLEACHRLKSWLKGEMHESKSSV